MPETEIIFAQRYFDTQSEAEAYTVGLQDMVDFALEWQAEYTFRWDVSDMGNHYEVVVFKTWEA